MWTKAWWGPAVVRAYIFCWWMKMSNPFIASTETSLFEKLVICYCGVWTSRTFSWIFLTCWRDSACVLSRIQKFTQNSTSTMNLLWMQNPREGNWFLIRFFLVEMTDGERWRHTRRQSRHWGFQTWTPNNSSDVKHKSWHMQRETRQSQRDLWARETLMVRYTGHNFAEREAERELQISWFAAPGDARETLVTWFDAPPSSRLWLEENSLRPPRISVGFVIVTWWNAPNSRVVILFGKLWKEDAHDHYFW